MSVKMTNMLLSGVVLCHVGCAQKSGHSVRTVITAPRFETTQPYYATDGPFAEQRETCLVLPTMAGPTYQILWFKGDGEPPVLVHTNQTYTFVIDERPEWASSGYLHCPGGAVPPGFLRSISKDGKRIWQDKFYKSTGCY